MMSIMDRFHAARCGVLNESQIRELLALGVLTNVKVENIASSSVDLCCGENIWKVEGTRKISRNMTVADLLVDSQKVAATNDEFVLDAGQVYIIQLSEYVNFSAFSNSYGLHGVASGKSSLGRLDILTRLIVDRHSTYDEIPPGYTGGLYLEFIPISFPVKLRRYTPVHQLRIYKGAPELSRLTSKDLSGLAPMLYQPDSDAQNQIMPELLSLSLQADPSSIMGQNVVAFMAIKNDNQSESTKRYEPIDLDSKIKLEPANYWVPVLLSEVDPGGKAGNVLKMTISSFYILRSHERLFLPDDVAVSCIAYTENLGELRIHYAGFAHPNFGRYRSDDRKGTPLIFEARCHNFKVELNDREPFAKIEYFWMSEPSRDKGEMEYGSQELKLSKYFGKWEENGTAT